MKNIDGLYPLWEERFSAPGYVYGSEPNEWIREAAKWLKPACAVLCIAEGEGRNAVFLASQGHEVTTWDYSEAAIRKQHQLAAEKGVFLSAAECVDLRHVQWPVSAWDAVVCVFGHFESAMRRQTLRATAEAVRPGGWVVMEVYSKAQLRYGTGGPKNEDWLYELADFTEVFAHEQWRVCHLFCGEVMRSEGSLHQGWSHVIQIAAQKRTD